MQHKNNAIQDLVSLTATTHDGHEISAAGAGVLLYQCYAHSLALMDKFLKSFPSAEDNLMLTIGTHRTALMTIFPQEEVDKIDQAARNAAGFEGVRRVVDAKRDAGEAV